MNRKPFTNVLRFGLPAAVAILLACAGSDPDTSKDIQTAAPPEAAANVPAEGSNEDGQPVVFRCVQKNEQVTGWCGKWELACRGKGPYALVSTRQQPGSCVGETPEVPNACETPGGVSRGPVCKSWEVATD